MVRVDSRRKPTDFPPAGLNADGVPTGGWWNYSGIQREVYLRKLDTVDFRRSWCGPVLAVRDAAPAQRAGCKVDLRNVTGAAQRVDVTGQLRRRSKLDLGTQRVAGATRIATFTDTLHIAKPRLWSPATRTSTTSASRVRVGRHARSRGYALHSGIRSIKVSDGRLILNGQS